jgi:hypothetical protein
MRDYKNRAVLSRLLDRHYVIVRTKNGFSPCGVAGPVVKLNRHLMTDPKTLGRLLRVKRKWAQGKSLTVAESALFTSVAAAAAQSRSFWANDAHVTYVPKVEGDGSTVITTVRKDLAEKVSETIADVWSATPSYPRLWGLLQYLLPYKARREVFQPSYDELLVDYYATLPHEQSRGARACLRFCFAFRTVLMLAECWRVLALDKLIPPRLRRWLMG